jgi:hypothetical protein
MEGMRCPLRLSPLQRCRPRRRSGPVRSGPVRSGRAAQPRGGQGRCAEAPRRRLACRSESGPFASSLQLLEGRVGRVRGRAVGASRDAPRGAVLSAGPGSARPNRRCSVRAMGRRSPRLTRAGRGQLRTDGGPPSQPPRRTVRAGFGEPSGRCRAHERILAAGQDEQIPRFLGATEPGDACYGLSVRGAAVQQRRQPIGI